MVLSQIKKKIGKYCCAYSCVNKPNPKKGGLCDKHYARKRRETNPVETRYLQFRTNANRRKKEFTITLDQFRSFCNRTGYIIKKGNRGMNATIDRRCNTHGYHIWNIQLLSHRENCGKGSSYSGDNFECPF